MKAKLAGLLCAAVMTTTLFAGVTALAEENSTVKMGLALSTDLKDSKDASADAEGVGASTVSIAAVTVDAEGRIVNCVIDMAQTKISFDAEGKVTTDKEGAFLTKNELGDDYGMRKASAIGREWNEQAAAFAEYCIGKTAEEISGLAVTEEGRAGDEDLAASCSIHVAPLQNIVLKAVENAVESGASATDKLGLGVETSIAKSADAAEGQDGKTEAYSIVTALTTDEAGVITSAAIDAVQAGVTFDAAGVITSDISEGTKSKQELGEAYGMVKASSIGREWNEQADAYAAYCVGKTIDEVEGTAVDAGVPTDADLAASVTIHITDFNATAAKAVENAK